MLHAVQGFIKRGLAVQMIVKRVQHALAVIFMQVLTPDIKMGAQLFGLIAKHRTPTAVVDDQLAAGNIKLPQAQPGAVQRGAEFIARVARYPHQPGVMLFRFWICCLSAMSDMGPATGK